MMSKPAIVVLSLFGWCNFLSAQEMPSFPLPGKVLTVAWESLSKQALPGYVADSQSWPGSIPSTPKGAEYDKVSGTGYATTSGIYSGGSDYIGPLQEKILSGKIQEEDLPLLEAEDFKNIGRFEIVSRSVIPGLKTLVFQIRIKGFPPGERFTPFELTQHVFPVTLSYNKGRQKQLPFSKKLVSMKLAGGFHEEIYALQWSFADVSEPIEEFAIQWAVYPHALTTGLRVDQSDSVAPPLDDKDQAAR